MNHWSQKMDQQKHIEMRQIQALQLYDVLGIAPHVLKISTPIYKTA